MLCKEGGSSNTSDAKTNRRISGKDLFVGDGVPYSSIILLLPPTLPNPIVTGICTPSSISRLMLLGPTEAVLILSFSLVTQPIHIHTDIFSFFHSSVLPAGQHISITILHSSFFGSARRTTHSYDIFHILSFLPSSWFPHHRILLFFLSTSTYARYTISPLLLHRTIAAPRLPVACKARFGEL
ncbi:hypothetical protein P171DRAFT_85860 [Karstenula rhodostoma CBS 690.94]|uniref:Uncharacterized protein n=1 Tax=Karstenula rhodostoma CBS 690.94 TaxID=1392251 RepID=A0A9P4PCP1_9PLEO|nr:hypothetical protein P171DRAFT_85860 [Karstenula rhodostoma CBS 690.94]